MTRVGTGYRYTDLERLRVEYWIRETDMSVREMAQRLGRSVNGLEQHLWRRGISVTEERGGGASWAGV